LDTCPKNDVISFFRKGDFALGFGLKLELGLGLRVRVRVEVRFRVSGNMFKYVFGQTSIRAAYYQNVMRYSAYRGISIECDV